MRGLVLAVLVLTVTGSGCAPGGASQRLAGAGSPSRAGASPGVQGPVAEAVDVDSSRVACAGGTVDLGVRRGFAGGDATAVRLCAVPGLRSTSPESVPGARYYVDGAEGRAIVNARISAPVAELVRLARRHGITLVATSSFRTMRHQRDLCAAERGCRRGDFTYVARAGFSQHQLGIAVDFAGTSARGRPSCGRGRAVDRGSRTWRFLSRHAHRFGLRQYAAESWHWDASGDLDRC